MDYNEIDQEEIKSYFRIHERVRSIRQRLNRVRSKFYNQTMVSHIVYDGQEVKTESFSVEGAVIHYLDVLAAGEETIKRLMKQKHYLKSYLASLKGKDRRYLYNRYLWNKSYGEFQQADLELYEEILEINEAICYMYGYPPEITKPTTIDNTTFEDDFFQLAEMLGV